MRILEHPILNIKKKETISFYFNDVLLTGFKGDTIASALWANKVDSIRRTEKGNEPRNMFCGIGNCYDCRVYLKGSGMVRACITPIHKGMEIFSEDREVEE